MDRPDKLVLHLDEILTSIFPPFTFSASCTPLHFYCFIMTCSVFFSRISFEILAFSEHLFSFHDILCIFLCSCKFLCFLEYWNICWLEYVFEIMCMKIIVCLCGGFVLIYLWLTDCCFTCVNCFGIHLTGSNLSWWWYFWKYICLNFLQEYVSQWLPTQSSTDGSFGK